MTKEYNATILTIGDEILIGQIVDSNSAWLADKLYHLGFNIVETRSIGDAPDQIKQTLEELINKNALIVITGGLGPTSDDRTKEVLNDFFGGNLIEDKEVLNDIKEFVKKRKGNVLLTENNIAQALVSDNAIILRNPIGTAPGQLFKKNNCVAISLPGVPFEMKSIFETRIFEQLRNEFQLIEKSYKTFHVTGFAESELSNTLSNWEASLPHTIKLAYLPSPGVIRLRLSDSTNNTQLLDIAIEDLKKILGNNIVAEGKEKVEQALGNLLKTNKLTISIAESCTGGLIAHRFTSLAGASVYFKGSITAYSNEAKANVLSVDSTLLEQYGAVSEPVARQMAIGAANVFKTDIAISTTGIAGPDGGSIEKPVGTLWIGIYIKGEVYTYHYHFTHNRNINIERSATVAMYKAIEHINNAK